MLPTMDSMLNAAWYILLELSPWLLLGAAIAGILHALVPSGWFERRLSGRGGILTAVLIGIPLPLCSCSVIPVGLGLRRNGASDGASVGFLISTPQTGVDSILVSASLLGWPFAVFKVCAALIMGLAGGTVTQLLHAKPEGNPASPDGAVPSPEVRTRWDESPLYVAARHGTDLLRSIWRWLIVGIVVSAALTWAAPPDLLTRIPGLTGLTAMLVLLLVSLPLYVCATASVPIAAALVTSGLPAGAAMVFLMAGPATNVATLGAVYRTFGGRTLAVYLATMILGSMIAGLLFDSWLAATSLTAHFHEPHTGWFSTLCAAILLLMLVWFCWQDITRWLQIRRARMATVTLQVSGMTCERCAVRLERALRSLDDVEDAQVVFSTQAARIFGNPPIDSVLQTVSEEGFEAISQGPG